MTLEEFHLLRTPKAQEIVGKHLQDNVPTFALSFRDNEIPTHLLATQLQNLQKSRNKFPDYYAARCIIPSRAFEQASSQLTASFKTHVGKKCLDLCCGLGVDSLAFSRNFEKVWAVEASPVLSSITAYNMQKMGVNNVLVHQTKAEEFLHNWKGDSFDLIYLDPDRRDAKGNRQIKLEDCSPNVFELMSLLCKLGKNILIKVSPLYDIHEAKRHFSNLSKVWIISVGNECKEVLLELSSEESVRETDLKVITHRQGKTQNFDLQWPVSEKISASTEDLEAISYLYEPDVAFYKSQTVSQLFKTFYPTVNGFLSHQDAYFFSDEPLSADFPGRGFRLIHSMPYKPSKLKKWLKSEKITRLNISRRHFPQRVKQIRQQLNVTDGGSTYLFCTTMGKKTYACIGEELK